MRSIRRQVPSAAGGEGARPGSRPAGNLRAFPPRGTTDEVWNHGVGRYTARYRGIPGRDVCTVLVEVEIEANSGSSLNGNDEHPRVVRYVYTLAYNRDGRVDESRGDACDWISVGGEALYAPLNLMEVESTRWAGHNPYVMEPNVRAIDLANGGDPARYAGAPPSSSRPPRPNPPRVGWPSAGAPRRPARHDEAGYSACSTGGDRCGEPRPGPRLETRSRPRVTPRPRGRSLIRRGLHPGEGTAVGTARVRGLLLRRRGILRCRGRGGAALSPSARRRLGRGRHCRLGRRRRRGRRGQGRNRWGRTGLRFRTSFLRGWRTALSLNAVNLHARGDLERHDNPDDISAPVPAVPGHLPGFSGARTASPEESCDDVLQDLTLVRRRHDSVYIEEGPHSFLEQARLAEPPAELTEDMEDMRTGQLTVRKGRLPGHYWQDGRSGAVSFQRRCRAVAVGGRRRAVAV